MVAQLLDCSNCSETFEFNMSFQRDANYTIVCPYCHHKHYRVVRDGRVTSDRWAHTDMSWQELRALRVDKAPVRRVRRPRRVGARTYYNPRIIYSQPMISRVGTFIGATSASGASWTLTGCTVAATGTMTLWNTSSISNSSSTV